MNDSMDPIQSLVCEQGQLMNARFQTMRGYGYAVYRLVGGHGAWKRRDAQKMCVNVNHTEKTWFPQSSNIMERRDGFEVYVLAVIREGGYADSQGVLSFTELLKKEGFVEVEPQEEEEK